MKSKYWQSSTHKFEIRVPKTVDKAIMKIDKINKNTLWYHDTIQKDIANVIVAFTPIENITLKQV